VTNQITIYYLCGIDPYIYRDLLNKTYWAQYPTSITLVEYKDIECLEPTGRAGRPYYTCDDYSHIMVTYK
jgi:hypothetical protein